MKGLEFRLESSTRGTHDNRIPYWEIFGEPQRSLRQDLWVLTSALCVVWGLPKDSMICMCSFKFKAQSLGFWSQNLRAVA